MLVCGWSRGGVVMCWGGGSTVFELDGHRFVRTFHEESKGERGSVSMAGENGWLGRGQVRLVVAGAQTLGQVLT